MKILGIEITLKHIAFFLIFSAVGLLLNHFNFSQIVGAIGLDAKPYFTYFQFIGPIAGGILGPIGGILSIIAVAVSNFILTGQTLGLPVVVSVITMSLAAIYFGSKRKSVTAVPLLCMVLFWLHPEGIQAWFYALFWIIPLAASFYKSNIFLRSLGATYSAHSVGSVAYLYAFNIPASDWMALMFISPVERLAFAAGITLFYYAVTTVLAAFSSKVDFSFLNIEEKYALWRV